MHVHDYKIWAPEMLLLLLILPILILLHHTVHDMLWHLGLCEGNTDDLLDIDLFEPGNDAVLVVVKAD